MKPHVGQPEVDRILGTDSPVPITKMTGRKDSSRGRYVQTTSAEPLTGIQFVLLVEHGFAVHRRTVGVVPVDPDASADLEGNA